MSRRILVLEDDESLRLVITKALSRAGFEVRATASIDTAVERMAAREADALVADVVLGRDSFLDRLEGIRRLRPDAPIIVMSAQTTAATALSATKGGAFEYLPKPFDLNRLVDVLHRALELEPGTSARPEPRDQNMLIGRSAAMQSAFRALARLTATRDPVLILGPEGSGRATAARLIHRDSHVDGDVLELGPERLAREGAQLFQLHKAGVVLLRRAEDWSPAAQALVLEALERQDTRAEGPRLIATAGLSVAQHLSPALLDRLSIGLVEMPALSSRGEDRALLFDAFLDEAGFAGTLSSAARERINREAWPGQVVQLRRAARRIAAQGPRGVIDAEAVAEAMRTPGHAQSSDQLRAVAVRFFENANDTDTDLAAKAQAELDAGLFQAALDATNGVRQDAARRLGLNRNTFARRLEKLIELGLLRPSGHSR